MILRSLVGRALLRPSHHYLPCHKEEVLLDASWGRVQVWREYSGAAGVEPQAFFLRFLGSRGRAEQATLDPADRLGTIPCEVWTMNPPAFGATSGPPDLDRYADASLLVMSRLMAHAAKRPVWVCGKSIGTTAAMLAASEGAAGVIMRNVMPLQDLLREHFAWRTGGVSRLLVAPAIPARLDTVANAGKVRCPGLFLVSREDAVSPPRYQRRVIERFGGARTVVAVSGGHDERALREEDEVLYRQALDSLVTPSA